MQIKITNDLAQRLVELLEVHAQQNETLAKQYHSANVNQIYVSEAEECREIAQGMLEAIRATQS